MSAHPYDNDPGLPSRLRIGAIPAEMAYPIWTHPSVLEHAKDWELIRDCVKGERQVKLKGSDYLRPLDEMSRGEYEAYIDRAVFFNMTGRTVSALTGIVFQRSPQISGMPKRLEKAFKFPTRNNTTFDAFIKRICRELVTLGRYGVLLDMPEEGGDTPYFTGYTAEHILDWQETVIDGKLIPTEIVVREVREERGTFGVGRHYSYLVRRLVLEWSSSRQNWVYAQYVYEGKDIHVDISQVAPKKIVPTRNGVPLDRIPFWFLGSIDNTPEIDRSPIIDIASLNIAHYRSYAQLEHSRFFTAMPVYYVQTPAGSAKQSYRVGSSIVWEVAPGERPGIVEMNGHGLSGLVAACEQKEDQISSLGGRLMANATRSVAESDNALRMKEGNERSILLNIVFSITEALSDALARWVWWSGVDNVDGVEVELNKDFLTDTLGARELRAVYAMYVDGAVPVTVLHHYLKKAEVVPDWMDVDQFKELLDKEDEFKNQPDVIAKMKGYNTSNERNNVLLTRRELRNEEELARQNALKLEQDAKLKAEQMALDAEEAEKDRRLQREQAEKDRKADEKKAKEAAKAAKEAARNAPAPAPGANPANGGRPPRNRGGA